MYDFTSQEIYFKLSTGTVVDIFYGFDNEPADEDAIGYISINGITADHKEDGGELDIYNEDKSLLELIPDVLEEMDWVGPYEFITQEEYETQQDIMQEEFNRMYQRNKMGA